MNPLGFCSKCKHPKIRRDGKAVCIGCDAIIEPPSGLVNTQRDPGTSGYKLIKNAKGFDELVPTGAETVPKEEPPIPVSHMMGVIPVVIPAILLDSILPILKLCETNKVELQFQQSQALYELILNMKTPENLRDAREIIKLQDYLESHLKGE
jgi:uncharacterized Zn finger protein (UPF0148 family)